MRLRQRIGVSAGGLVLLIVGAVVVWRTEVARVAAERWLANRGFPEAALTVSALDHRTVVLTDARLGPEAPSAARITVRYTPGGLAEGRVQSVTIKGLRAAVDPFSAQPLPRLQRLAATGGGTTGGDGGGMSLAGLPRITLRDAVVTLATPKGPATATLDLRLTPDTEPLARLDAKISGKPGRARLRGTVRGPLDAPSAEMTLTAEADLAAFPPTDGVTGRVRIAAEHTGRLPAPAELNRLDTALRHLGHWTVKASATDVARPPHIAGAQAKVRAAVSSTDRGLAVRLAEPATASVPRVGADVWRGLGVPAETAAALAGPTTVTVKPTPDTAPTVKMTTADDGTTVAVHAPVRAALGKRTKVSAEAIADVRDVQSSGPLRVTAEALDLRVENLLTPWGGFDTVAFAGAASGGPGKMTLNGTVRAKAAALGVGTARLRELKAVLPVTAKRAAGRSTSVSLDEPGRVTVGNVRAGTLAVKKPVTLKLTDAEVTASPTETVFRAAVAPDPLTIAAGDRRLRVRDGRLTVSGTMTDPLALQAEVQGAALRWPGANVAARAVNATATLGPDGPPRLSLDIGTLRRTTKTPAFHPVKVTASATRSGSAYTLNGAVTVKGTGVRLPIRAKHNVRTGAGRADLPETTLSFTKDGLQPENLSPLVQAIKNAAGDVSVQGHVAWDGRKLTSGGRITVNDLDATLTAGTVEGLNGTIELKQLVPPATAPAQRLRVKRLTAALPLRDVTVTFEAGLGEDGSPELRVAKAVGHLAGGRIVARDVVWQPDRARIRAPLHIADIALKRLIEQLALENVSATGSLVGTLPVRVEDGNVLIDGGLLKATGDGVVHARIAAAETLARAGGKHMRLMLKALKDFRYKLLEIAVNRPKPGKLTARLSLEGHNPDVLDGHPFRFNIRLRGDMRPLIRAVRRGQGLRQDLLNRALDLAQ